MIKKVQQPEEFRDVLQTELQQRPPEQERADLEIQRRAIYDGEWMQFLEALAGQTAIAIDGLATFQDLQRSNMELELAYDATIEGWSHAIDLRDKETEGYTLRITGMALKLARAMGVSDDSLVHLRRGGLLHDIGKWASRRACCSSPAS